ncbi:hypothetical protein MPER_05736 [Moniliophthora perniciosa FA553]|nr:hypothetical protein MPER_05736 [Moniliophthora perniciosa FA553]
MGCAPEDLLLTPTYHSLAIITIAISAKNNSIILLTIGLLNFGEVFVIVNIFTNALVTLLIAGRIFWISHQLRAVLGRNVMNMYRTIIAITLESGIIYPIILSLFGATRATVAANVLYYSLIQVVHPLS